MRVPWRAALLLIAIVDPEPALAHTPIPGLGGFAGGLLHPALVPAHGLGLFGFGLLIGQQKPRDRWVLLTIFAAALMAAVGAIVTALAFEEAATVVLAAACVAGILVAVARPVPRLGSAGLAVLMAVALMLDSVPETISMRASLVELAGTALGACLILAIISAAAAAAKQPWQRIGVRILGSWTAAAAIFVLALQFARA
jgi:urease accessory protein